MAFTEAVFRVQTLVVMDSATIQRVLAASASLLQLLPPMKRVTNATWRECKLTNDFADG
jgi:hypothetical protein